MGFRYRRVSCQSPVCSSPAPARSKSAVGASAACVAVAIASASVAPVPQNSFTPKTAPSAPVVHHLILSSRIPRTSSHCSQCSLSVPRQPSAASLVALAVPPVPSPSAAPSRVRSRPLSFRPLARSADSGRLVRWHAEKREQTRPENRIMG